MSNKFNVNIPGNNGNVIMGDNTNVDIRNNSGVRGSVQAPMSPTGAPDAAQQTQKNNSAIYKINHGYALIIHNHNFSMRDRPHRDGSEKDVEAINKFCTTAGLTIETAWDTEDLTATQIDSLCSEISKRDFTRYDAFVCFILSHGNEDGIYGVEDKAISIQQIVSKFKECPTLANKPKLFFIQACRGTNKDRGIEADNHPVNEPIISLRLPTDSDILIAHSSVEGNESYRNPEVGSWFIITLTEILDEHAHDMHLMDILTLVNKKITEFATGSGFKQMPCQMSTLTKFVYFNKYPPPAPPQKAKADFCVIV